MCNNSIFIQTLIETKKFIFLKKIVRFFVPGVDLVSFSHYRPIYDQDHLQCPPTISQKCLFHFSFTNPKQSRASKKWENMCSVKIQMKFLLQKKLTQRT